MDWYVQRYRSEFLLMSHVSRSGPPRRSSFCDGLRTSISVLIIIGVAVGTAVTNSPAMGLPTLAVCGAVVSLWSQTLTLEEAKQSINGTPLVIIGAGFGLATAVSKTGLADWIGQGIATAAGNSHLLIFVLFFVLTCLVSNVVFQTAAVTLIAPVANGAVRHLADPGLTFVPFIYLLTYASGAVFLLPIAMPGSLMVWKPGGYDFGDYAKLGLPLLLVVGPVTVGAVYFANACGLLDWIGRSVP
eukprot:TRINITY_DN3204_c0_g1_i1.p1 TRINITY_DN3204_c0_g1~~TRINITY_DN3204_c0_g1_i1.p1  ORF type:complete len:244 (+),score=59.13 TRINITY_DN3204_c0_g1_i1:63-794(+)